MKKLKTKNITALFVTCFYLFTMLVPFSYADTMLGVTVCGVPITTSNCQNVFGDNTVSYDYATKTLFLNNFRLSAEQGIISEKELTVNLSGENSIQISSDETKNIISSSNGNLSFSGNGTLYLSVSQSSKNSIKAVKTPGNVSVYKGVTLNITTSSAKNNYLFDIGGTFLAEECILNLNAQASKGAENTAIYAESVNWNKVNGQIQVGNAAEYSTVIFANNDIKLNECELTLNSGDAYKESACLLSDGGKIDIGTSKLILATAEAKYGKAIYAYEDVIIQNSSNIQINCNKTENLSYGIRTGATLRLCDSVVKINVAASYQQYGIQSVNNIEIKDNSELNIELSASNALNSEAVHCGNDFIVNQSQVRATANSAKTYITGAYVNRNFIAENATLVFCSGDVTGSSNDVLQPDIDADNRPEGYYASFGMSIQKEFDLKNSTLHAQAGNSENNSSAIRVADNFTVSNSSLTASLSDNCSAQAQCAVSCYKGNLIINNASLNINGKQNGVGIECDNITIGQIKDTCIIGKSCFSTVPYFTDNSVLYRVKAYRFNDLSTPYFEDVTPYTPNDIFINSNCISFEQVVPVEYTLGDINGDGVTNAADARLALRAAVGLETFTLSQFYAADMDMNLVIEAADARILLRIAVDLEHLSDYTQKRYYVKVE